MDNFFNGAKVPTWKVRMIIALYFLALVFFAMLVQTFK